MERLQKAIEKARAERDRQSNTPAAQPAKQTIIQTMPERPIDDAWAALEKLHLDHKQMHRNRVTAFEPGADRAPFDLLRTRILQQASHNGWQRVAIVSPHSACGKSTTAANLSFSFARHRTLRSMIFDFDFRRAGLTKLLGQQLALGMSDVLERKADFANQARRFGNNIAFGLRKVGKTVNPSELLQSSDTPVILDEISERYKPDIMLFDMPPLMASDDNFGFLQNVDCALIMVAAEKTPMSQIDVAERHVSELTNVMGIVLNMCHYTSGAHGHEYGYY